MNSYKGWLMDKQNSIRDEIRKIERNHEVLRTILAIAIALIIILILVFFVSSEPLKAVEQLFLGPLSSVRRFGTVIETMIPLTFTGLAISITFSSNRFNLISDSTFQFGGILAIYIALTSPFGPVPTIILILLASALVGGLFGLVPAYLHEKFNADVLVNSLMLNYVIGHFANYILNNIVRDPQSAALQSYPLPEGVNLGQLVPKTRIHAGLIIVLVIVVIAYIVVKKTKWGYKLRVTGENEHFAKYSGVNVAMVTIIAQVIGAGIAGLGGAVEMLGIYDTYMWTASPGYGFDGVIIATLARNNPAMVPVAAFFLAYIRAGADIMNRSTDVPAEIVSIVQAVIIILIAAQAFLSKWKQRRIIKASQAYDEAKEVA